MKTKRSRSCGMNDATNQCIAMQSGKIGCKSQNKSKAAGSKARNVAFQIQNCPMNWLMHRFFAHPMRSYMQIYEFDVQWCCPWNHRWLPKKQWFQATRMVKLKLFQMMEYMLINRFDCHLISNHNWQSAMWDSDIHKFSHCATTFATARESKIITRYTAKQWEMQFEY